MAAKYFIYRNLNRGGYSIKHRGRVIEYADCVTGFNCEYRVSQASRNVVLKKRQRSVHAYVVCDSYRVGKHGTVTYLRKATYRPFDRDCFFLIDTDEKIETSKIALLSEKGLFVS